MSCYEKLLDWIDEEQNKFPDDDLEISQLVAYSTLELVKRKIIEFKTEEKTSLSCKVVELILFRLDIIIININNKIKIYNG